MTGWIRSITLVFAVLLAGCANQAHTESGYNEQHYSDAELDQILAPIALYPDVVLSQVLMASTFPLDIEEAADWSAAHSRLNGTAAVNAVSDRAWDLSVQALTAFPDLLRQLADDPGWTWSLGDAYIHQESDVLDAIQRLRDRAYAAGHLASEDHLQVYRDNGIIIIEPTYPDRVYLPYYSPLTVYGSWWWPDYPPYYWDSPYGYKSDVSFYWGDGIVLSSGFFYSAFHWDNRHIVTFDRGHYRPYRGHGHYYQHHRNAKRWRHHRQHRNVDRYKRRHDYNAASRRYNRNGYWSGRHSQPGYRQERFRDHPRANRNNFTHQGRYRDGRRDEPHRASGERQRDRRFNAEQRSERRYQHNRQENRFRADNQRARQNRPATNHNTAQQPGRQGRGNDLHRGPGQQRDRQANGERRRFQGDKANRSGREQAAAQRDNRNHQEKQHRSPQRNQRKQAANRAGRETHQAGQRRHNPDRAGNGQTRRDNQTYAHKRQRDNTHRTGDDRHKVTKSERREAHGRGRGQANARPNPRARYRGDASMQRPRAGANHRNGRREHMR